MEKVDNSRWLELIPPGWVELARKMLDEISEINPSYKVEDMKEKWGTLRVYGWDEDEPTYEIIRKYEQMSARTCCICGTPAVKISTGYILPFCDKCGKDEEKYYKRIE